MELRLFVRDSTGRVEHEVKIAADEQKTIGDLTEALIEYLGWPTQTQDGRALNYHLRLDREGIIVHSASPLRSAGLREADSIVIVAAVGATATPSGMLGHLTLPSGEILSLTVGRMRIGRAGDNELVIQDPDVSRHHATLEIGPAGDVLIRDAGSKNGVLVNGRPAIAQELFGGEQIEFGDYVVRVTLHVGDECESCKP